MTGVNEINRLVKKELEEANKQHPMFHSNHEAYAVILEEVEETEQALIYLEENLKEFWHKVRTDSDTKVDIAMIRVHAIEVAQEAIQVAAMCNKAIDGLR